MLVAMRSGSRRSGQKHRCEKANNQKDSLGHSLSPRLKHYRISLLWVGPGFSPQPALAGVFEKEPPEGRCGQEWPAPHNFLLR